MSLTQLIRRIAHARLAGFGDYQPRCGAGAGARSFCHHVRHARSDAGSRTLQVGRAAPGILAAALCALNMIFVARYLKESRDFNEQSQEGEVRHTSSQAIWRVISHSGEPASRLIWIYAIAIGAFQGSFAVLALFLNVRFQVTAQTIGYFFMYVGAISVFTRVLLLGAWSIGWVRQISPDSASCSWPPALSACRCRGTWDAGAGGGADPLGTALLFRA